MATNNSINANATTPLPIVDGGTAVNSVTIVPAATAFAGWDANKNLTANNHINSYTTIATAAGTTVLTVGSTYQQFFTGSTTQTVTLPVTSTLVLGQQFYIANNSTGVVTVQSSGANTIVAMAAGSVATFTVILTSGTTATSWASDYTASSPTGSGGLKSFQIFTSGTAATYTKPAGIASILVELCGGGGGGGGSLGAASSTSAAAGGGAGGYARLYIASASATYTYTVGPGGAGGVAGNNVGTTGTTTTFSASSLQATGGVGGNGAANVLNTAAGAATGGAGGAGSNGNINANGQAGGSSIITLGAIVTGFGGNSYFGGGAVGNTVTGTGSAGNNYGAGGSGGGSTTVSAAGGAGSAGVIIVWEFS